MRRKTVSGIMLSLLLTGVLILTFNIQQVKASGTIYIRADGSIEGTTDIMTVDNITYTFTDNINDSLVVERDNIVVDGAGYTLQGTGSGTGINMTYRNNVTIKNMEIKTFDNGINLAGSSNNTISRNNITANNRYGMRIGGSNNTISGNILTHNYRAIDPAGYRNIVCNNLVNNNDYGFCLLGGLDNTIASNTIINNFDGICFLFGEVIDLTITNNIIANNAGGISTLFGWGNSIIYHNDFIDNSDQVYIDNWYDFTFVWDDGYPSGGNYWSDYPGEDMFSGPYQNETGSDGIGDTPYLIDVNNQDNYPLLNPWTPTETSACMHVTTDKETYGSNENILISGNLTLDDSPVSDGLVTLQVDDPEGNLTLIRTLPTGPDVTGPWPVEILEVIPLDEFNNPCYIFQTGDYVGLKIKVQNGNLERNVTITLNAYYRDEYPFAAKEFTHQHMYPHQSFTWIQPYAFGPIAPIAPAGTATVYVNAFTKWPRDGGYAYCPEKLATFNITSGTNPPVELTPTSGNFNLSFKILPGYGKLGNYTIYASSYTLPFYATNSTTFELKIIGDITGPEGIPDGRVDMRDVSFAAIRFGAELGDLNYDPRADITGTTYLVPDGIINMRDISLIASHFGEHV